MKKKTSNITSKKKAVCARISLEKRETRGNEIMSNIFCVSKNRVHHAIPKALHLICVRVYVCVCVYICSPCAHWLVCLSLKIENHCDFNCTLPLS